MKSNHVAMRHKQCSRASSKTWGTRYPAKNRWSLPWIGNDKTGQSGGFTFRDDSQSFKQSNYCCGNYISGTSTETRLPDHRLLIHKYHQPSVWDIPKFTCEHRCSRLRSRTNAKHIFANLLCGNASYSEINHPLNKKLLNVTSTTHVAMRHKERCIFPNLLCGNASYNELNPSLNEKCRLWQFVLSGNLSFQIGYVAMRLTADLTGRFMSPVCDTTMRCIWEDHVVSEIHPSFRVVAMCRSRGNHS